MLIEEHRGSGQHIPEAVIWTYLRQLVKALHHCHEPATRLDPAAGTIIHRDIKPANGKFDFLPPPSSLAVQQLKE